ncbi:pseudouridine synthase [Paenirhodobacter populi]|uniref:Pseudouridine synthase n=1 Tax=Paenirhodobacter populi TaxID=2306993 RepID=A0A443INS0_9RHOB|nr:pseudouridine synthase [Sinirhodobacter populi]RWR07810.1 pseudouridine synthase [Sinirhodobacter populi]
MTDTPSSASERIAKVIARSGVASRRDAEKMILEGRVSVNGKTIASPALDVRPGDKVVVDGKPLDAPQETRLWLYYKPLGLVTTEKDEQGRRTIFDEMPSGMPRVLNIGRLDLNSEGLLLLTNDGGLKRRLEHPETAWLRKYRVRVNGRPMDDTFNPLRAGITIEGEDFQPMEITLDRQQGANAWLTVGIREGRNREIRRAMAAVGMTVNRLIRVSYGPFRLNEMQPGDVVEVKRKVIRDQLGDKLLTGAEDGRAPLAERVSYAPKRGPGGDRPMRSAPRDGDGPRTAGPGEERKSRWSKDGKPRADKPRAEGFRSHRDEGDRPARKSFGDKGIGDKGFARKPRPAREDGERRGFGARDGDDRKKPFGKRPFEARDGEARPARRFDDDRKAGFGAKPQGKRPYGGRDDDRKTGFGAKPQGKRPFGGRDDDARPARRFDDDRKAGFGAKPQGNRPFGGRDDDTRPPRREGKPEWGDRPRREGTEGRSGADRKPGGFGKPGGFQSAGYKSQGAKGKPRTEGFKSHRAGDDAARPAKPRFDGPKGGPRKFDGPKPGPKPGGRKFDGPRGPKR